MYHLLLVDDEPFILDGLCYNIDWEELDIQEVFRAENAADALEILKKHRIDLLITDVHMPAEDGISMSEKALLRWPYTKIIVLTGYRDFEYAQRAVQIHVFRYLLKPIRYEDLVEVAGEALSELQSDLQKQEIVEQAKKELAEQTLFLRERYFLRWLERDTVHHWVDPKELAKIGLDIRAGDYGFWVTASVSYWDSNPPQPDLCGIVAEKFGKEVLGEEKRLYCFLNLQGDICFLFLDEDQNSLSAFLCRTVERLDAFLYGLQETLKCRAVIFWDFPAPLHDIGGSYRRLERKMSQTYSGDSGFICGPELPDEAKTAHSLKSLSLQPSFFSLLAMQDKEQTLARLEAIFNEIDAQKDPKDAALEAYHEISGALIKDSLQRRISIGCWGNEARDFLESSSVTSNIPLFRRRCVVVVSQYLDFLTQDQNIWENQLVRRICGLVAGQLSENLSVNSLAIQCHYNAAYLSRLFKKETGMLLQDYIIQQRMEKAKKMLENGSRIGEVAQAVGYENFPHFSRAFKKTVGVSPKQYQSSYGITQDKDSKLRHAQN